MTQIDIVAPDVVHLFRSMRDVQVALPGLPVQQACAYLCQYKKTGGIETVAVFHLLKSDQLAFYCSDPRCVSADKIDNMLDQGLNFVESMGFLLSDMDIRLLDDVDRERLWNSLPFRSATSEGATEETYEPAESQRKTLDTQEQLSVSTSEKEFQALEQKAESDVDDLLAAVESMRAKRSELRTCKKTLSVQEIGKRRIQLRETLGRILSSL